MPELPVTLAERLLDSQAERRNAFFARGLLLLSVCPGDYVKKYNTYD
jgi:hypothetical protein